MMPPVCCARRAAKRNATLHSGVWSTMTRNFRRFSGGICGAASLISLIVHPCGEPRKSIHKLVFKYCVCRFADEVRTSQLNPKSCFRFGWRRTANDIVFYLFRIKVPANEVADHLGTMRQQI